MTISSSKQKKIKVLFHEGMKIPDIVKKTGLDYKTAKKYALMNTTSQPQPQVTQQSVITSCSPSFTPAKPKRVRDTTRITYEGDENITYYRPVRVVPPSSRSIITVSDVKPPILIEPLTKMQKEQEYLKNRKGIDVSWVPQENEDRRRKNQIIQREVESDIRRAKDNEDRVKAVDYINQKLIENKKNRDKSFSELHKILDDNKSLTESEVRDIVKHEINLEEVKQNKIARAYGALSDIQNKEIYRIKKKQINEKFLADIVLSGLGFVSDVVKSAIALNKKTKVFKVQLVEKPMQARVIK